MENGGDGEGDRSRRNITTNDTNSLAGLTLGAVLSKKQTASNRIRERTLLDMIRDDPTYGKDAKKTWKTFRDKLRLKRAGAAWTSTVPIPASDIPIQRNSSRTMMMRRGSSRYPTDSDDPNEAARLSTVPSGRSTSLRRNPSRLPDRQQSRLLPVETDPPEEEREEGESPGGDGETGRDGEGGNGGGEGGGGGGPVVKMSLMALLAETDREMGLESAYLDDDEEEEEEEEEGGDENSGEYNNCCVCMVRHKGAAFIPCGHTFCRLCSRELWVQRGNCPLCNNFILEILDIF